MNWNRWIRQIHRWVSIIFTVTVAFVAFLTFTRGEPPLWMSLLPLLPLAFLLLTGLYLFVLPYAGRWRGGRASD